MGLENCTTFGCEIRPYVHEFKGELPLDPAIPFLSIYPKIIVYVFLFKDTYRRMFIPHCSKEVEKE